MRASADPGAPPRLPRQDTTGEAGYVAGTGPQRRAGPGFSSVRAMVRLRRRAGMAGLLPPEGSRRSERHPGRGQARHRLVSASARPAAARPASRCAGSRDAAGVAAMPHGVS